MKKPQQKKHSTRNTLLVILGLLAAVILYYIVSSMFIHVVPVSVHVDVAQPIRIVHLTDLHNKQFGKNNEKLVEEVAAQKPDLIIMSGDMLNRDDPDTDVVVALISDLSSVAPVYFGYGNHEKIWEQNYGKNLRIILESAGAVVVDNDYLDLDLKGTALRIGGYMGFYPISYMTTDDDAQEALEDAFMKEFENTDRVKLLINHIPTGWIDWNYVDKQPVDLVFSGHYHGGVFRIPILDQGLYAPYVGWFPKFTKGVYAGKQATCILSAGLGSEYHVPRFNNPPEIVVVDLVPINE